MKSLLLAAVGSKVQMAAEDDEIFESNPNPKGFFSGAKCILHFPNRWQPASPNPQTNQVRRRTPRPPIMRASPPRIVRSLNPFLLRRPLQLRSYKPSNSAPQSKPTTTPPDSTSLSRADRILSRLPGPLQKYATRLRGAPGTHVIAFLLLHEITAIVPVFALFGLFHYTEYVPIQNFGTDVKEGAARMIRYLEKKGWLKPSDGGVVEGAHEVAEKWESYKDYTVLVEFAAAYAVTKVLLPVRIAVSLWATPWFARVLGGVQRLLRR
ncbi:hypothetical protein QBC43DRAFT_284338 [Cladorrhinum sp. PSN259]|nr:hypothetical protein QBC43DRAFT_284338 [Cladorrhinum sp. PSN259]